MKKLHIIILLVSVAMSSLAQTVGEAFYIYRNDCVYMDIVNGLTYKFVKR